MRNKLSFKMFLEEADRRTNITVDESIDLIYKNCYQYAKEFLSNNKFIYRGFRSSDAESFIIDPKFSKRTSANTKNYYTLMLDNFESWKNFPNRSESLICTSDESTAYEFGSVFCVFPFDGAKIGICPRHDLWFSFEEMLYTFNDLSELNDFIDALFKIFSKSNAKKSEKDFNLLMKNIRDIDKKILNEIKHGITIDDVLVDGSQWVGDVVKEFIMEYGSIEKALVAKLDPKTNKFKLASTPKQLISKLKNDDVEIWTDSKCICIDVSLIDDEEFLLKLSQKIK